MSRLVGLGLAALAGCTLDPITETEKLDRRDRDRDLRCAPASSYAFESRGWGAPVRPDVMMCSPDGERTAAIEVVCRVGERARVAMVPTGMTCGPNVATSPERDRRECVVVQPARTVEVVASCANWWGEVVYRASP